MTPAVSIATQQLIMNAEAAEQRIRPLIRETPLEYSPYLSELGRAQVYLKFENQQVSGSFKFRGLANFMRSIDESGLKHRFVTASTGNHAAAFSHYLHQNGRHGIVFLPKNTMPAKVKLLQQFGVETRFFGGDIIETEAEARRFAATQNRIYVPPYNHAAIIAGHATLAIELERQLPALDSVLIPVGGGGLASGVAGYLKAKHEIRVVGCQPLRSAVMYHSVNAGKILDWNVQHTLADGCAGGIEPESITFDLCRRFIDEYTLLEEEEIAAAIMLLMAKHHVLAEGAAALSVAAFMKHPNRFKDQTVVLIISGKRIDFSRLKSLFISTH